MKMFLSWPPNRWSFRLAIDVLTCGEATLRRVYRLDLGPLVLVREEFATWNPMAEAAMRLLAEKGVAWSPGWARLRVRYSHAWPHVEALEALKARAPIVEVGAGTGYWAWMLRNGGVTVFASDIRPPRRAWTHIDVLDAAQAAAQHPEATLFLCWPPPADSMALRALTAYHGRRVVVAGDYKNIADAQFFTALARDWVEEREPERLSLMRFYKRGAPEPRLR
ncbi:MAG TPA: hypothetical protein VIV83_07495 [Gemmatimonadales bacterium]|jgi:hypothetical protein